MCYEDFVSTLYNFGGKKHVEDFLYCESRFGNYID